MPMPSFIKEQHSTIVSNTDYSSGSRKVRRL